MSSVGIEPDLGPDGGAGQLPWIEGVAGAEVIADLKGRAMGVARLSAQFDAPVRG
jgi:hypothetical protein